MFVNFSSLVYQFYWKLVLLEVKVKPMKKSLGTPNWVRNWGFCHFLKATSLVFLDIVEDHRQHLTSNRAETTINFLAQIGAELILSILMSSSAHSSLLSQCLVSFLYVSISAKKIYTIRLIARDKVTLNDPDLREFMYCLTL